jgi:hypothetical protein
MSGPGLVFCGFGHSLVEDIVWKKREHDLLKL